MTLPRFHIPFWRIWDDDEEGWFFLGDRSGTSSAVHDAPGEFTEITIGWDGGEFFMAAGDTELWRFEPNATFVEALGSVTDIWLAGAGDTGSATVFDWFEVTGTESGAAVSKETNARRDLLERAAEAREHRPDGGGDRR